MKTDEWIRKVVWMSKVNGEMEVGRGRIVWELLARPSLEHAANVWLTGGQAAFRKLESVQMRVGLLGPATQWQE